MSIPTVFPITYTLTFVKVQDATLSLLLHAVVLGNTYNEKQTCTPAPYIDRQPVNLKNHKQTNFAPGQPSSFIQQT
jgi:hypothetical protein